MKVILTHERADGDAIASMLAASKLYPDAIPILPRLVNRNIQEFLTLYGEQLPFVAAKDRPHGRITEAVLVDTQTVVPIKGMGPKTHITIIDHHPPSEELDRRATYVGRTVGATATILVEQLREARISLTPVEATLLLIGIHEDTGSLLYSTTTPADLRAVAWLMEQGANLNVANATLHHPLDSRYRTVYTELANNAELFDFHGHSVLIATARPNVYLDELSSLAHKLGDLFEPDATFLIIQLDSSIQLIARSSTDDIDVGELAKAFGGGGHSRASAALISGPSISEIRAELLRYLQSVVKPVITVRDIMSYGVHTLPADLSLAEAQHQARRYGHEGFPVVEEGQVVGVVTSHEIDRAMHHRLGHARVSAYMHKGNIYVSPSDSVARVQQVMMEYGVGQVPVVENGQIIGVVTRTDLIKAWGGVPEPARRVEIQDRLKAALPAPLIELLLQARDIANEMGYSLYVVGGFVRDLLLGVPNLDLDLVVEGDAIALARALAQQVGGRVRGHSRFGTAKIILGEKRTKGVPPSLDFVTARTEFYEHPSALPEVERSSIKQDLYRRDFTINTMAICLDRDRYGELLDFYGGERDLRNKLIRVLHNLSFVEDPTRMLRAVRLEQRLGFRIESRTAELITNALDLLDRVTGDRLRHELNLIFAEREPENSLQRLAELGILARVHPALRCDAWLVQKFRDLRERATMTGAPSMYMALMCYRLSLEKLNSFAARLHISREEMRLLEEVNALKGQEARLAARAVSNSTIYRILEPYRDESVFIFGVATDRRTVQKRVDLYLSRLRYVEAEASGDDLRRRKVPPGPLYRQILDAVLDARLDGRVQTREEEERLIDELLTNAGWKPV